MKADWRLLLAGIIPLACLAVTVTAHAQTVLTTGITAGTTYTFGDTTFKFASCFGSTSTCGFIELLGIKNGRGGTEIEVEVNPSFQSYIFANNGSNQSGNFVVTIATKTGTRGISSVTNIVNGSDGGVTANDGKVTSVLSSITGTGTVGGGSLISRLNETPVPAVTWPLQTTSFTLTDTLNLNGAGVPGTTLRLTNVHLLFQPAPEPASLAVLATGLAGLAGVRRRFRRLTTE
jgi:hypothetical protein